WSAVGCIRIIQDEREALGTLRQTKPRERGGRVCSFAGVLGGDLPVVLEARGRHVKRQGPLLGVCQGARRPEKRRKQPYGAPPQSRHSDHARLHSRSPPDSLALAARKGPASGSQRLRARAS